MELPPFAATARKRQDAPVRKPRVIAIGEAMTRKPTPEELKQFFSKDEFARFVGCAVIEAGEGRAKVRMEIGPHHLNGGGLLHGGAVFTAADLAGAVAANSHGRFAVALSCTVTYMKPAKGRAVVATAREISRSRRIGTYVIDVIDEDSGEPVASLQEIAFITDRDIESYGSRT